MNCDLKFVRVFRGFYLFVICSLLAVSFCDVSFAAIKTWTGSTNSDWTAGGNWSPAGAPVNGDSVVLPTAGINRTINLAGDRTIVDLTFNSTSNYRLGMNQLTLASGDITSLLGSNHRIDSNLILGDQAVWNVAAGSLNVYGSVNSVPQGSFGIRKTGAGKLNFNNNGPSNSFRYLLHQGGNAEFFEGTYTLTSTSFDANAAIYMADGTVTVSHNANVVGTSTGNLVIQSGGTSGSNLSVEGEGTEVSTFGQVFMGVSGTAGNTITVRDRAVMKDIGLFIAGFNGNASASVRDRGTIEANAIAVGMLVGATGNLNIQHSESSVTTSFLALGGFNSAQKGGTGTATISDRGALNVTGDLRFFSSTSSLIVDSANATVGSLINEPGVTGSVKIRNDGRSPALTITSPVTEAAPGPFVFDGVISNTSNGIGGIVKQGPGEQVFTKQQTYTGGTLIEGGMLTLGTTNTLAPTGSISVLGGTLNLGNHPQQVGEVTLQGGTISGGTTGILLPTSLALQSGTIATPAFVSGTVTKVTSGTATINAPLAANAITVTSGTLVLNQGATAPMQVNGGSLNLKGNLMGNLTTAASGSVNISGATLVSGVTSVSGSLNIGASTFVSDTNQPMAVTNMTLDGGTVVASQLDISGTFAGGGLVDAPTTFASTSKLKVELGGTTQGTQYDHLDISGLLSADGTLDVSLINEFTPTAGMSFDILDWGTLDGTFAAINLPELDGLLWDVSDFYQTGAITVIEAFSADFNLDGDVDGEDLTSWQAGYGVGTSRAQGDADGDGDVDGRDFMLWQRQFGSATNLSSTTANSVAVPEPGSVALIMWIGCGCLAHTKW